MSTWRPPEELYPFSSHWLELPGGRMHYLDEGPRDAPVLLMLHGNPTWSFYYRNLVLALREHFRCIVPDHIGCGLSDKPGDDKYRYHLDRRIEDIQSLVSQLSLHGPVNLIVHDWGGMIGFGWAVRHKPDLGRLVILNTAAFPMPAGKKLPFALWMSGRTPLGTLLVRGFNAFAGLAARVAFRKKVSAQVRKAYTGPYDSWNNRIATLRFVQDIPLTNTDPGFDIVSETGDHLDRFRENPALVAWGMKDFVFDHHFLNQWRGHLPDAEVVEYPDCGHYVLEDAGQDLVGRIKRFLVNENDELE